MSYANTTTLAQSLEWLPKVTSFLEQAELGLYSDKGLAHRAVCLDFRAAQKLAVELVLECFPAQAAGLEVVDEKELPRRIEQFLHMLRCLPRGRIYISGKMVNAREERGERVAIMLYVGFPGASPMPSSS